MLAGLPISHQIDGQGGQAFLCSGYSSFLHRGNFSAVAMPTILLACILLYKTLYLFSVVPNPREELNMCLTLNTY